MVEDKQVMISVIIPVYNSEKYLHKCIDSLLSQSYTNFEVILVNDGSTDGSAAICNEYTEQDNRVNVFHQKNKGVSAARNIGIENVNGKWICFVDSDDWLDKNHLINLHNGFKENLNIDLTVSGLTPIRNKKVKDYQHTNKTFLFEKAESKFTPDDLHNNGRFVLGVTSCAKLFKKEIIDREKLLFKKGLRNGEDYIFVLEYALKCREIFFTGDYSYNYDRTNEDSSTIRYNENLYYDLKMTNDAYFSILERYRRVDANEKLAKYFDLASQTILAEGKPDSNKPFLERYKSVKEILRKPEIIEFRKKHKYIENSKGRILPLIRKLMKLNQPFLLTVIVVMYYKIIVK